MSTQAADFIDAATPAVTALLGLIPVAGPIAAAFAAAGLKLASGFARSGGTVQDIERISVKDLHGLVKSADYRIDARAKAFDDAHAPDTSPGATTPPDFYNE